jgi:hypothetical protein
LALRLFQIASTEGEPKNSVSVISSARNPKSQANLLALCMDEIATMPEWLEYDVCSWTRMSERALWRHYVATADSLHKGIEILEQAGLSTGLFNCKTIRMPSAGPPEDIDVSIEFDLPIRQLFTPLLQARQRKEAICNFVPLPSRVF